MIRQITFVLLSFCSIFVLDAQTDQSKTEDRDYVKLGGAVRVNAALENYENSNKALNSYMKLDTWFLSVDARQKGFELSFQYRFYPESKTHFIHHAYVGYGITNQFYVKAGIFQKPFGITPSTAHSWWYQMPYYMGLEDTYNTGIGASYDLDKFRFDLAYFRQAAPNGPVSDNSADNAVGNGRFSYAVVPTYGFANGQKLDANIRQLDQINTRIRYQALNELEVGFSGQLGSIYNRDLDKRDWGFTWAAHAVLNYGRWNFKGQVIGYNYNASANNGQKLDIVQMAAYGSAYDVAAKGMAYTTGLSYTIPVNRKFLQSIDAYVDYSIVHKSKKGFTDSQMIVPGVMATMGPLYVYLDWAIGKNQPWLTSDFGQGLGEGSKDAPWNSRLNLNIGYYFDATIFNK